jgi:hypothetical protein
VNSEDQATRTELAHLRRIYTDSIELMDGLLNGIVDEMMAAVDVQAGGLEVIIDPIFMRVYAEVDRQLMALPGKPPAIPLMPLTHAQL